MQNASEFKYMCNFFCCCSQADLYDFKCVIYKKIKALKQNLHYEILYD